MACRAGEARPELELLMALWFSGCHHQLTWSLCPITLERTGQSVFSSVTLPREMTIGPSGDEMVEVSSVYICRNALRFVPHEDCPLLQSMGAGPEKGSGLEPGLTSLFPWQPAGQTRPHPVAVSVNLLLINSAHSAFDVHIGTTWP